MKVSVWPRERTLPPLKSAGSVGGDYEAGQVVQHAEYGIGQVTDVSGFGALRKLKVRFAAGGEKTFIADMVKLTVVQRKS